MASCFTTGPKVSKGKVDSAILEYIVVGALPFTHVKTDHFKKLVSTLRPNTDVLCYPTLIKMMNEAFEKMVSNLKSELAGVAHVCTTADLWTGAKRGFMGMTGSHLDENLERKVYTLCCTRMKGSHTNEKVPSIYYVNT